MAKLALINREQKRRKTVAKFKAKRAALLEVIQSASASDDSVTQHGRSSRHCHVTHHHHVYVTVVL